MRNDIEVGDYLLVLDTVPKLRQRDGETNASDEAYAIRARVTRLDKQPVHGSMPAADSGEMTGDHGPFGTVAEALAHGEAWGRHYVSRILGHAV